jgi:hypothetical protein
VVIPLAQLQERRQLIPELQGCRVPQEGVEQLSIP